MSWALLVVLEELRQKAHARKVRRLERRTV